MRMDNDDNNTNTSGVRGILREGGQVLVQGHQQYHVGRMLIKYPEREVISGLADEYLEVGRCSSYADAFTLASQVVVAYRSNEAGEAVPQRTHGKLKAEEKSAKNQKPSTQD